MVLSATHRYKKKYVTTLLYKPIGVWFLHIYTETRGLLLFLHMPGYQWAWGWVVSFQIILSDTKFGWPSSYSDFSAQWSSSSPFRTNNLIKLLKSSFGCIIIISYIANCEIGFFPKQGDLPCSLPFHAQNESPVPPSFQIIWPLCTSHEGCVKPPNIRDLLSSNVNFCGTTLILKYWTFFLIGNEMVIRQILA